MKTLLTVNLILLIASGAFAQTTPLEFLNAVPQPPLVICKAGIEGKIKFQEQLAGFDTIYQAKMNEYKETGNDKHLEDYQDEAIVNMLMKSGYSREDAEKMKNADNMSEQEKMELANNSQMKNYNMTMDEMSQMKKLAEEDTAALRRKLKAKSTRMMAETQLDQAGNQKKQLETKTDIELRQDMKLLNDKLRAGENKYIEKIREIGLDADSALLILNPKLEKLQKDLSEGNGNSDQIIDEIIGLRKKYCESFTPSYLEIVEGFKGYITEHMQDYFDLEEMQMQEMERQTGMKNLDYKPGAGPMGIVGSYRNLVGDAFKYNLNAEWGAQFIGY
jgi:hypothetical protein